MHIADMNLNILGANGIVGASMPLSSGAALAAKLRGSGQVVVAFFGDGASNQGVFHEAVNLASVWKLPLVFVCENNQYALTTSFRNTTSVEQIAQRAAGYSMPGVTVDGNNVAEVFLVAQEAIERARRGDGPSLIEAMTYRCGQHSMRANLRDPRPGEEYDEWMAKDPIKRIEPQLDDATVSQVSEALDQELQGAIDYGRKGPEPSADLLYTAVYAPHPEFDPAPAANGRELSFQQALNEALHQEMARDERVLIMGEDVGATGGIFTVTKGLFDKFGEARVRDTPISEAGFVGCGVGAAIAGLRPIVEIQIFDFVALTMDMLVNQAAKFRFMLGGKNTVPLVIRGPQGGGIRLAAQHSQSLEAWFTHVPGLVVMAPSTPYDAKGLLVAAIRDNNPVIFLEAKLLYMGSPGPVPEELYALPIGKADIKREGSDVTVVATMAMVPRALAAAEQLSREGISVEVIDPRTLRPLDEETILTSVRKTGRLVIAHEAWVTGGFGAEVAAIVADKALMDLDAPIKRVGALDVPMPYHDGLERLVIPSTERIMATIREVAGF
jgi:2-oxoisovalerate dehydrogenase E1 component